MEFLALRCPWVVAGPLAGLLVVGLLWFTNRPLGATGGWIDLLALARRPSSGLRWTVFFLAGIALGGFVFALATGTFRLTSEYGTFDRRFGVGFATRAMILVGAGVLMGYGTRTAGGCTSGHGICGTSLGSAASWVSTAVFMTTAIAATQGIAWWLGVP